MGPSVAAKAFLDAPPDDMEILHVELSDRRPLATLGRLDAKNALKALLAGARLFRILLLYRPDVACLPLTQTSLGFLRDAAFLLLARCFRVPALLHLHGGAFRSFYARCRMRPFVRFWLRRSAGAIVLSERLRGQLEGLVPRLFVVPNGVDAEARADPGGSARVLFLSNARRDKGLLALREAMAFVRARRPEAALDEAGEGTALGPVAGEAKERLFRGAALFALPTALEEGQPVAIVEALAHGLPVVATPMGAIPDMVRDGENGFLVPPGDPRALAEAIDRLLADPALRARMGEASRALHAERFTAARHREGLAEALRAVARRSASVQAGRSPK